MDAQLYTTNIFWKVIAICELKQFKHKVKRLSTTNMTLNTNFVFITSPQYILFLDIIIALVSY